MAYILASLRMLIVGCWTNERMNHNPINGSVRCTIKLRAPVVRVFSPAAALMTHSDLGHSLSSKTWNIERTMTFLRNLSLEARSGCSYVSSV
eukprot:2422185-Pleurochrysis_carterae.AAC.3